MNQSIKMHNGLMFPNFLKILFFVEMWERFSYYGMRALLVLFLTSELGFSDPKAYAIYSLFAAIGYTGPVIGGILADKLMGFKNMVLLGGITLTIGHTVMALVGFNSNLVYIGLATIAVGTGMFKGNITNLLGTCYAIDDPMRSSGFNMFYVSVNLGSFIASIVCSYVAYLYGWHYGFGIAGIGMFIGLMTFTKFQYILKNNGLSPLPHLMNKKTIGLISVLFVVLIMVVAQMLANSAFYANILAIAGSIVFGIFGYIIFKATIEHQRNLIALFILIVFFMGFFAIEMQLGSLMNLFAQRNVENYILGFEIPSSLSQAINPLSIIVFGTFLGFTIKFDKKYTISLFMIGLLSMVLCFIILYMGCINANDGKVSYSYLFFAITLMGMGELFIGSITNNLVTLLAPNSLKGFAMGILMLAAAFSNLAGIVISKFMSVPQVNGIVDVMNSLEIYKEGFSKIGTFTIILVAVFVLCFRFLQRTIMNLHD